MLKYEDWEKQITIVCDKQEKQNYHIKNDFKNKKIPFVIKHMKAGDYGFIFKEEPQAIFIERKNSLTELSGNLSTKIKRDRFYREFEKFSSIEKYLLVENDSIDNLISGTYGSNFHQNSYIANFLLLERRYNLKTYFVNKYNMAAWILKIFYYYYYAKNKKT